MLLGVMLQHCRLAKAFEARVKADDRFEVKGQVSLGLVSFRLKVTEETERQQIIVQFLSRSVPPIATRNNKINKT